MTLIKGNSVLARRAANFGLATPTASTTSPTDAEEASDVAAERDIRDEQIEELKERAANLEAALTTSKAERETACTNMLERGRTEGREAAEALDQEYLATLASNLANLVTALGDHIDEQRDVAIDIAYAALGRLFADPALYASMVAETARHQAAALARGSVVQLRVSALDFPDDEALAILSSLGSNIHIETDRSIERGACMFDLTLGTLDASVRRQATAIEGIFAEARSRGTSA